MCGQFWISLFYNPASSGLRLSTLKLLLVATSLWIVGLLGLRGAMAFALALQSIHELPEGHGQTIFTATTAIVVLTVRKISFVHSLVSTQNWTCLG